MASQEHIVFVGDPGAGKSTLLSSLRGQPFPSGTWFTGKGLTTQLQTLALRGKRYSDAPGLDDVATKTRAAREIVLAIEMDGAIQLMLVLTLEAGRIRGANVATVKLVLDAHVAACICVDDKCSIILNAMPPS